MRKPALAFAAAAAALLFLSVGAPAQAITDGVPDGDGHPEVGLMVAFDEDGPVWRCSGTLVSPTVYVTAGHCTSGATHVELWFDDDVRDAAAHGYPNTGEVSGTPYTHPQYDDAAFYLYDLGVVVLDEPVILDRYASLPALNQLDVLANKKGQQDRSFTAVGYGLQKSFPDAASWKTQSERLRMVSTPRLISINTGYTGDGSLILSNNAHTGGTCSGDSGGPNFLGAGATETNILAATTITGDTPCRSTNVDYRLDTPSARAFLGRFVTLP